MIKKGGQVVVPTLNAIGLFLKGTAPALTGPITFQLNSGRLARGGLADGLRGGAGGLPTAGRPSAFS
jgi:hypothetical protein